MDTNIETTRTISATYEMKDTARGITANVRVADSDRVEAVENGTLATDANPCAATFNSWGPDNLSVQFNTAEGRTAVLADIEAFINAVKTGSRKS